MGGCCASDKLPLSRNSDITIKKVRRNSSHIQNKSDTLSDNSTTSDTDNYSNKNKKKKKNQKKKPKNIPIYRDESFIEVTPTPPEMDYNLDPTQNYDNDINDNGIIDDFDDINNDNISDYNDDDNSENRNINNNKITTKTVTDFDIGVVDVDQNKQTDVKLKENEELLILGYRLYTNLDIKDRKYKFKTYKQCFIGSEMVDYLIKHKLSLTRNEAVILGGKLLRLNYICHVEREHDFEDRELFYRFVNPITVFKDVTNKYGSIIANRQTEYFSINQQKEIIGFENDLRKQLIQNNLIKDRKFHFKIYKQCFIGKEVVTLMINSNITKTRIEAIELIQLLMDNNIIQHVTKDHNFNDNGYFYEFVENLK